MVQHDLMKMPNVHVEPPRGEVELIVDAEHYERVVLNGILKARVSLDITTADFKAMLVPAKHSGLTATSGRGRRHQAPSIVDHLVKLASEQGVEIRLLHAGVPTTPTLKSLKKKLPGNLTIRRCPRLHAKSVIIDAARMYLGSANLTGAGLGAKHADKRNIEWGIWTESSDLIDGAMQQFNRLWEGERCQDCRRKEICPVPLEEPAL